MLEVGDGEILAKQVREIWKLGLDPIPNITELLEEQELKVLTVPLPQRVSGFACIVGRGDGGPDLPVIVVNNQLPLERRRLTLAHEMAHSLIDKDEEKAAKGERYQPSNAYLPLPIDCPRLAISGT